MEATVYNAKKQKMYLESQSRKWHIETVHTIFWYIVVIFMIALYKIIRIITIMVLFHSFSTEPFEFAVYLEFIFYGY